MRIGKEMQFFGARANLAKCLLYALNGGIDEKSRKQIGPKYRKYEGDVLEYDKVMEAFNDMMEWLAGVYVNTLNVIHYMHDKYCYERAQMSLHDRDVRRYFATGIAGLSVVDVYKRQGNGSPQGTQPGRPQRTGGAVRNRRPGYTG